MDNFFHLADGLFLRLIITNITDQRVFLLIVPQIQNTNSQGNEPNDNAHRPQEANEKKHIEPCSHEHKIEDAFCCNKRADNDPYLLLVLKGHYQANQVHEHPHGAWIKAINQTKND